MCRIFGSHNQVHTHLFCNSGCGSSSLLRVASQQAWPDVDGGTNNVQTDYSVFFTRTDWRFSGLTNIFTGIWMGSMISGPFDKVYLCSYVHQWFFWLEIPKPCKHIFQVPGGGPGLQDSGYERVAAAAFRGLQVTRIGRDAHQQCKQIALLQELTDWRPHCHCCRQCKHIFNWRWQSAHLIC